MLRLHRRHLKSCSHTSLTYRRCTCPVWVFGTDGSGKRVRKSLDTRNWEKAERDLRDLEPGESFERITIQYACERFTQYCETRRLAKETLGKYELLVRELKERFKDREVKDVSVDDLSEYQASWKVAPVTSSKKIERLRTFFKFCLARHWLRENRALELQAPIARHKPTLPFSDSDMEKVLWATEVYKPASRAPVVRAFILLLRYSGLRIRDAVTFRKSNFNGEKIILYTQKTGTAVYLPLPVFVREALQKVETHSDFFFWSGNGEPKSAVNDWQRTLGKLFTLAGVRGHAHMLRDTFAVDLLSHGVSIEDVAILLGHSNTLITQKHYAPWVKSRQLALEISIEKAWKLN